MSSEQGVRARVALPRRRPWVRLAPIAILAATGLLLVWSAWPTLRPGRVITVRQAVFDRSSDGERGDRQDRSDVVAGPTVQAAGWIEPDPYTIACAALADGVVAEMFALEGDSVERGAIVARLVDADARIALARAEADLQAAEAMLAAAEADLAAATTEWEQPVERERAVAAGRASLEETRAELAQLPSLVAAEDALLEQLREEHRRAQLAFEAGAATDIEVVILQHRVEAQDATASALRARRPLLEARRARLEAELAAAERNATLRVGETRALAVATAMKARADAEVEQATARRNEAALRLERMEVRAPISGIVQRRLKSPGDKVITMMDDPHSAHLVHLYDPKSLQVRVDVPLADASHIFRGQECEIVVEVLPDRVFRGEVTRVTHEADLQKNTLQVKVSVLDPSPVLRPEMLARVKFLGAAAGNGRNDAGGPVGAEPVLVPSESIRREGNATLIWVVRSRRSARGVVRGVPVETLGEVGLWTRVRGEVRVGDLIAVGQHHLRDGQSVRVTAPSEGASS